MEPFAPYVPAPLFLWWEWAIIALAAVVVTGGAVTMVKICLGWNGSGKNKPNVKL